MEIVEFLRLLDDSGLPSNARDIVEGWTSVDGDPLMILGEEHQFRRSFKDTLESIREDVGRSDKLGPEIIIDPANSFIANRERLVALTRQAAL